MKSFWIAMVLASAVSISAPCEASAEGWLGNLFGSGNKQSEKKKTTSGTSFTGSAKKSNPANLTESSKSFFAPVQSMKQPPPKKKSFTGLQATRTKNKPAEKPSFWKSWFTPEEPKQPKTVGEWMAQPRVSP